MADTRALKAFALIKRVGSSPTSRTISLTEEDDDCSEILMFEVLWFWRVPVIMFVEIIVIAMILRFV